MRVPASLVIGLVLAWWCAGVSAQWTDDAALNTPVVTGAHDQDVIKLGVASDGTMLRSADAVDRGRFFHPGFRRGW